MKTKVSFDDHFNIPTLSFVSSVYLLESNGEYPAKMGHQDEYNVFPSL